MNTCSFSLTSRLWVSSTLIHWTVVYLCPLLYIIPLHEYTMMDLATVSLKNTDVAYSSELALRKFLLTPFDMRRDGCKSFSTV